MIQLRAKKKTIGPKFPMPRRNHVGFQELFAPQQHSPLPKRVRASNIKLVELKMFFCFHDHARTFNSICYSLSLGKVKENLVTHGKPENITFFLFRKFESLPPMLGNVILVNAYVCMCTIK